MPSELADFPSESRFPPQQSDGKSARSVTFEFVRALPDWPEHSVIEPPLRRSRRHWNGPRSRIGITRTVAALDALAVCIAESRARCLEGMRMHPLSNRDVAWRLGTCAAFVASSFMTGWLIDVYYPMTAPDARPIVLRLADTARTPPPPAADFFGNVPAQGATTSARRRGAPVARPFTGRLTIRSVPSGAKVWVDQTPIGPTPLVGLQMRAGSHAIWIEHAGFQRWSAAVHVPANTRTEVAATLDAAFGVSRVSR